MASRGVQDWQDTDFGAIGAGGGPARAARRRRSRLPLVRLMLGSTALITVLTLAAIEHYGDKPRNLAAQEPRVRAEAPVLATPPPVWRPAATRDIAVSALPDALAQAPFTHHAEMRDDGARRDAVTLGEFRSDAPHLHLVVLRGEAARPEHSFFVATTLDAADAGLAVERVRGQERLETQRLPLTVARMVLEDDIARDCFAFRSMPPESDDGLMLTGWSCGTAEDPSALACLIDDLDLVDGVTGETLLPPPEGAGACGGAPVADAASRSAPQDIAGLLSVLDNGSSDDSGSATLPPPRPEGD
ncbi:MAG: hypothetical protein JJU21_08330 [Salinarimonas sp.]|nr:hypothetical protein [Salinarimonas sp.]